MHTTKIEVIRGADDGNCFSEVKIDGIVVGRYGPGGVRIEGAPISIVYEHSAEFGRRLTINDAEPLYPTKFYFNDELVFSTDGLLKSHKKMLEAGRR